MLRINMNSPSRGILALIAGIALIGWSVIDVLRGHPRRMGAFLWGMAPFITGALVYLAMRIRGI